jgi:hypothetical protein
MQGLFCFLECPSGVPLSALSDFLSGFQVDFTYC